MRAAAKPVRLNLETKLSPTHRRARRRRYLRPPCRGGDPRGRPHGARHHPVVRLAHAAGGEEARARDRDRLPYDRDADFDRSRAAAPPSRPGLPAFDLGSTAAPFRGWSRPRAAASGRRSRATSAGAGREAHALALKVLPWTVNDPDMAALIDAGADGLITDYPDRAREVMARRAFRFRNAWTGIPSLPENVMLARIKTTTWPLIAGTRRDCHLSRRQLTTGASAFYGLWLAVMMIALWVAQRLTRREVGISVGDRTSYFIALAYPVASSAALCWGHGQRS